jgi:hypothetical protein
MSLIDVEARIAAFPHSPDQERKRGSISDRREVFLGIRRQKLHSGQRLEFKIRLESPWGIQGQHKNRYRKGRLTYYV